MPNRIAPTRTNRRSKWKRRGSPNSCVRMRIDRLGNDALADGYAVYTTIDSKDQDAANQALRDDLMAYDQRHGFRGPEAHIDLPEHPSSDELDRKLDPYHPVVGLVPGIVTDAGDKTANIYLSDGQTVSLDMPAVAWANRYKDERHRGAAPKKVSDVLAAGDVVRVARNDEGKWKLSQMPSVQGALIALNPEDGAIRAEVGGFSFSRSKFNRAVQSSRQPGSSFKPFFYSAAFEHGFTPASIINDAPIVFADPSKPNGLWTPQNDDGKFDGPMRLREAMVVSKNLVSVRLLDAIGVHYAREFATKFGFSLEQIPDNLSMALGTASVSPLTMARAYAVLANGGFLVEPYFIDRIVDRDGNEIYKAQPARRLQTLSATPARRHARRAEPKRAAKAPCARRCRRSHPRRRRRLRHPPIRKRRSSRRARSTRAPIT